MVLEKKGSARVEAGQRRVLDEATRQRRLTRQLEALEKDNFQVLLPACQPSASQKNQRRRRGRRGATTSSSVSERTSPHCWRRRTCPRSRSQTTCRQQPLPPRCPPDTSAASVASRRITPVPPVGGATAAAGVCAPTERPGVSSGRCNGCRIITTATEVMEVKLQRHLSAAVWNILTLQLGGLKDHRWTQTHLHR